MTPVSGTNSYTYAWDTSSGNLSDGAYIVTVAGADLAGNQIQQSYIVLLNQKAIFHFNFSDTNSHIGQTVNDLSGNNYHGLVRSTNSNYYDSTENAFRFANSGADGVAITNLNYISGESDKINNLTIQAKIKASSENSSKQRIILSFDRSSVLD